MKIEMFEKIGEVVVAEVRTAEENKAIADNEIAKRREEARIKKEQKEKKDMEIAASLLPIIIENINSAADDGRKYINFDWTEKATVDKGVSLRDWQVSKQYLSPILEKMGYKVNETWYSKSWRGKSGKIGGVGIYWY